MLPRKIRSLRDHGRGKDKSHSLSAGGLMSIFKTDGSKSNKDGNDEEKEKDEPPKIDPQKIEEVQQKLEELEISDMSIDHIKYILQTEYADGDPLKAAEFIDFQQKATAGIITAYDPAVHMVGAENRESVTCYIDALLFAMFCSIDAFECMLKADFTTNPSKNNLVTLLRLWVNMLRSGKLIRTDMTELIQDALADCGWADARELLQQDTSEAFVFLTEELQLPLLSLQVDLFHQGKRDAGDSKVVYERLLNLAVPDDPEGKGIRLEDCLEEYFNARVEVSRGSEEAKKAFIDGNGSEPLPLPSPKATLRLVAPDDDGNPTTMTASPIAISPLAPHNSLERQLSAASSSRAEPVENDADDKEDAAPVAVPIRPSARHRSTSLIQRVVLDEKGHPSTPENPTMLQRALHRGSTVVKAVTIPAWQFFRLIPWHALNNNEPSNDSEVAMNFDQKPVVCICLKRYLVTNDGLPKRHNTFIDIPDSLRLPHFMLAGDAVEEDPRLLNTDYKLVLQSVVCHRGDSLQGGHYISFARVAPKVLTGNRRHNFDPPPDYEEAQWVMFDDLVLDGRVKYVENIREALKEEMPYLLFYQVVPMADAPSSTEGAETEPPSYNQSKASLDMPPTPAFAENGCADTSYRHSGYFDTPALNGLMDPRQSKPPSIRLSADMDRFPRKSTEEPYMSFPGSTLGDSRRQSMNLTDSAAVTPAITPDGNSPAVTPGEDSTATRLSRAASRFAKGRQSRPNSQSGDNRISITMTRLSGRLKRQSKEPLAEPNTSATDSAGPPPSDTSLRNGAETPPVDAEKQQLPPPPSKHKRGKSKEKNGKQKSSAQPERECTLM